MALIPPRRVLLIQIRRLGDVVLSTALLEDLHRAFPGVAVDYLVGPAAAPLIAGHPLVRERLVLDSDRTVAMWREVRSRGYDWVIDVQGNLRTALLARASGARVRVGWRIGAWRLWYTHARSRRGPAEYVIRGRQRLLELTGMAVGASRPSIHITCAEREQGERAARASGAPADAPRVGFVLSTRDAASRWSADRYGEVAACLARDGVVPLLLLATPADEEDARRAAGRSPGIVIVPAYDLRRFLGVLATCRVFVSGDTGPAHMADALGVPRVTIYGATHPAMWNPGLPTTLAVHGAHLRAVPTRERKALDGDAFTGDITAEAVLAPIRELLRRNN